MKKILRISHLLKVNIVCVVFFTLSLSGQTAKKHILLIGMEKVDNISLQQKRKKTFDNSATIEAKKSLANITKVVAKDETNLIVLTSELATKKNILDTISYIGNNIKNGDTFLLYFFGHGYQIEDKNNDESDKLDEVLVVYDDYLIDDEINQLFITYFSKTKNLMLVDACHSGSSNKGHFYLDLKEFTVPDFDKYEKTSKKFKKITCEFYNKIDFGEAYNLIYFGATNDNNTIPGYSGGGIIAYFLNEIMAKIRQKPSQLQKYTYGELACDLHNVMSIQVTQKELQFHEYAKTSRNYSSGVPFEFN